MCIWYYIMIDLVLSDIFLYVSSFLLFEYQCFKSYPRITFWSHIMFFSFCKFNVNQIMFNWFVLWKFLYMINTYNFSKAYSYSFPLIFFMIHFTLFLTLLIELYLLFLKKIEFNRLIILFIFSIFLLFEKTALLLS